jgi:hypothetical protein
MTLSPIEAHRSVDDWHLIREIEVVGVLGCVTVIEAQGSFASAARTVNDALLRALFVGSSAVVCDLSSLHGAPDVPKVKALTQTGGHLRNWPATGLLLVSPVPGLSALLRAADAGPVLVYPTVPAALATLRSRAFPITSQVHLKATARASRVARDFVSRTCLDWHRAHDIPSAVLVVSELVTNGLSHSGTDMDVTISAVGSRLRLAIRDGSNELPRVIPASAEHGRGRGLHVVQALSQAWGVLPGPDGGKTVWAVLGVSPTQSDPELQNVHSPVIGVAPVVSSCVGETSRRQPAHSSRGSSTTESWRLR